MHFESWVGPIMERVLNASTVTTELEKKNSKINRLLRPTPYSIHEQKNKKTLNYILLLIFLLENWSLYRSFLYYCMVNGYYIIRIYLYVHYNMRVHYFFFLSSKK